MVPMSLRPPRNQELVLAAHSQLKRRLIPNSDGIEEPDEVPAEYELAQEDSLVSENVTD